MNFLKIILLTLCFVAWCSSGVEAQSQLLGTLKPRSAKQVASSNWSVGAETMDRDFTIYNNWKAYLGPLGVKKARIQAGWAKTEQTKGVYDWRWLDEIIFDMVDQGVEPWVNLAWGNLLYTEHHGSRPGPPKTEEALNAWELYVRGLVARYQSYIDEWEVWNEGKGLTPQQEATLIVRTAEAIRNVQPSATVIILALDLAHFRALVDSAYCAKIHEDRPDYDCQYGKKVLDILKSWDKLSLIDEVSYHPYDYNPDNANSASQSLQQLVKTYDPRLQIRQGENGVPSEQNAERALAGYPWTETTQAKWALRRMLGDLGMGISSSYFSIADMQYNEETNRKGLLYINKDQQVDHPKMAYYAIQHLTAIFDDRLMLVDNYPVEASEGLTIQIYQDTAGSGRLLVLWDPSQIPSDIIDQQRTQVKVPADFFKDPVYVDLLTGKVYDLPDKQQKLHGKFLILENILTYDAPVIIAERSLVPLESDQNLPLKNK